MDPHATAASPSAASPSSPSSSSRPSARPPSSPPSPTSSDSQDTLSTRFDSLSFSYNRRSSTNTNATSHLGGSSDEEGFDFSDLDDDVDVRNLAVSAPATPSRGGSGFGSMLRGGEGQNVGRRRALTDGLRLGDDDLRKELCNWINASPSAFEPPSPNSENRSRPTFPLFQSNANGTALLDELGLPVRSGNGKTKEPKRSAGFIPFVPPPATSSTAGERS